MTAAGRPPGRRPARRPVGRARRLDRVRHRDRRRPGRRGLPGRAGPDRPRRGAGGGCRPITGARTGRRPPTTTRPRSARRGRSRSVRRIDRLAATRPAPVVVHRPARAVRRGRDGPGAARGGRPGLHRLGRRGVGDRHGQDDLQADLPRASGCRSSTGARSARPAGRATRTPSARELEAFAAGAARPAADGQAGAARQLGRDDPRPRSGRARRRPRPRLPPRHAGAGRDLRAGRARPRGGDHRQRPGRARALRPGRDRVRPRVLRLRRQVHGRACPRPRRAPR